MLALISIPFAGLVAFGQTSTYVTDTDASGSWHAAGNWDNGIPNATDAVAILNQPISTGVSAGSTYTLSLGGNDTVVGTLTSNNHPTDPTKYFRTQITQGTLVFRTSSGAATLNENLGAADQLESRLRINVPVRVESDLVVNANNSLSRNTNTEFAQRIDGAAARTITKEGQGNLQLGFAGTLGATEGFLGNLVINAGGVRLIIPNGSAAGMLNPTLSKAAGVTVNSGGQLQIGNALSSVTLGPGAELKLNGPGKPAFPGLVTQNGALRFDGAGEVVASFNSPVNLQSASQINVAAADSTGVLSAEVRGVGLLQKSGNGLLKLAAANVYSGGTTISNGALAVSNASGSGVGTGDVAVNAAILGGTGTLGSVGDASNVTLVGGTLAPGDLASTLGANLPTPQLPNLYTSAGRLTILGDLAFDAASTMQVDLTGAVAATGYDQVVSSGAISLSGATLNLSLGAYVPAGTETFTLINNTGNGAISGAFGNYAQGAAVDLAGKTFYINYMGGTGNDVVLSATQPGTEDADFDNDGDVDGADFLTWQRNFGTAGDNAHGNANGDGTVDGLDLAVWRNQFGAGSPANVAASAIPEPASAALLLLAAGALAGARRSATACRK
ncbi:autotransporter-associated beta strand repeat-containing protein [Lacipirellula parvula]|nr:autotransporter-associated beta strand repeat-containing protein [Lacipirellula parvula]